jgi:hypothetical protein
MGLCGGELHKESDGDMKPKRCKNYDTIAGCIGCRGIGSYVCKGYDTKCYDYRDKRCKHVWNQVDKFIYITDDGMPAKAFIDYCKKCGKARRR